MNAIRPLHFGIQIALIAATLGGCRKEEPKNHESSSIQDGIRSDGREANEAKANLQNIQLQEKDFRSRLEKTKAGVAKLGNKTRKKLKPDMASLDAKSVRLDSLIRALPSLPGPEINPSIAKLTAILDSANTQLAQVQKFLK